MRNLKGLRFSLQKIYLGITGKNKKVIPIVPPETSIGYTTEAGDIHLSFDNDFTKSLETEEEKMMFIKGVFTHEVMHQLATNFEYTKIVISKLPVHHRKICQMILNVIEDPAIEYLAPFYIGGHLVRALAFSIAYSYKLAPKLSPELPPFLQFFNALVMYGDGGFVKGDFTSEKAKKLFARALPIVDRAITESNSKKRIDLSLEVFEISKPLWEDEVNELEKMKELFDKLEEESEKLGKTSPDGKGTGSSLEDFDGEEVSEFTKKKMERRKITVKKISKEEAEEMGLKKPSSDALSSLPDGDLEVFITDEKSEEGEGGSKTAIPVPDLDTDGKSEKPSDDFSDFFDDSDFEFEFDDKSESKDTKESFEGLEDDITDDKSSKDDKSDTDTSDTESSDADSLDSDDDIDGEELLDRDDMSAPHSSDDSSPLSPEDGIMDFNELEITDEDIKIIKNEIATMEKEERLETPSKIEEKELDVPITLYGSGVRCQNNIIKPSLSSEMTSQYEQIRELLIGGINRLTNKLRRIFNDEVTEKAHRASGRLDVKALTSSRMTPRVFTRRKEPANKSNIAVLLLVDESGSMCGQREQCARQCAIGLAEVFGNLNIPTSVIGFTGDISGYQAVHNHYLHWQNKKSERTSLLNISAKVENFDGYSIRYATELLSKRKEEHKLLVVISDGVPACSVYYRGGVDGVKDTAYAIREARKKVDILGVAIGNSDTEKLFSMWQSNFFHISNTNELFEKLSGKIAEIIKKW